MGLATLLTAALAAATLSTAAVHPRAPAAPRLARATFSGNGCPAGSANRVSGSTSRLKLEFPDFHAALGGPDDPASRTRNCNAQLTIEEGVPGWALAVRRISGEGMFYGTPNVSLRLFSTSFWQDNAAESLTKTLTIEGDADRATLQQVSLDVDLGKEGTVFASKCVEDDGYVGMLSVNLRALVSGASGSVGAFIGNPVTEHIEFAWVPCGERPVEWLDEVEEVEEEDEE